MQDSKRARRARAAPRVFLGPSLSLARAREILPSADYHPPVRQGDLGALPPGCLVAIIDGVTGRGALPMKELSAAIRRGVHVIGGGAVGAFYAHRTQGMTGIGRVYERFRRNELRDVEEVSAAFDHGTLERLTEPLVSVRASVESLVRAGSLGVSESRSLLRAASRIAPARRTYANLVEAAGLAARPDSRRLVDVLRESDIVREDAHTVLEAVDLSASRWRAPATRGRRTARDLVVVWEYGEGIELADLLDFVKLTGRFDALARDARGCSIPDRGAPPRLGLVGRTPQEAFDELRLEWDWRTDADTSTTLAELGITLPALGEHLARRCENEREVGAFAALTSASAEESVRIEMLLQDLALKRECLRLSSLRFLAASSGGDVRPLDDEERLTAAEVFSSAAGTLDWRGHLGRQRVGRERAGRLVDVLALARREGTPLARRATERIQGKDDPRDARVRGRASSPRRDAFHAVPLRQAAKLATELGRRIGVQQVECAAVFEGCPVHVALAYRLSPWNNVGSGKGRSATAARIGAMMEEVEKFALERFQPVPALTGSYQELHARHSLADPGELAIPHDTSYRPSLSMSWLSARDLASGRPIHVPQAMAVLRRMPHDILFSPRLGSKLMDNNGLASAFDLDDALSHALCEVVERHALHVAALLIGNPGGLGAVPYRHVHPETLPGSAVAYVATLRERGFAVRILDVRSDVRVPAFAVRVFKHARGKGIVGAYAGGSAAHPDPAIALEAALVEAFQTLFGDGVSSRGRLTLRARSLGRSMRPSPVSRGDMFWYDRTAPLVDFGDIRAFPCTDSAGVVTTVVRELVAAGYRSVIALDVSGPAIAPARVVRVLVPRLGGINPLHLAPVVRALSIADLMARTPPA